MVHHCETSAIVNQLHVAFESVIDERTFLNFLKLMAIDFEASRKFGKVVSSSPYGSAAFRWENKSLDHFLESGVAWAKDTTADTNATGASKGNVWNRCAAILLAGKYYE